MKKTVLISGGSIAGLSLAFWLNRFGYKVTVVEMAKGLRKGGSPIDVRGEALNVAEEMGILEKIKAKKFLHTDEIVNAKGESLVFFELNNQPEYSGDIEIHREDLVEILYENLPKTNDLEFLFDNRIEKLIQHDNHVVVTLKSGETRFFDLVFGADGTHSAVRKFVFGAEENYAQFFGGYFALAEAYNVKANRSSGVSLYKEVGTTALIFPFEKTNTTGLGILFRSPKLNYDYKNSEQHKQILKDNFKDNHAWKIPEILETMLHSDNLYFDEICQIHMDSWSKGRVALVGDAAYTASFLTGMGTSLAMQGATVLAKDLHKSNGDYETAFSKYYQSYKPYVENIQARIHRGLTFWFPQTEEELQAAIERFKSSQEKP